MHAQGFVKLAVVVENAQIRRVETFCPTQKSQAPLLQRIRIVGVAPGFLVVDDGESVDRVHRVGTLFGDARQKTLRLVELAFVQ